MILGIVMAFIFGTLGGGILVYFYLNGSSSEEKGKIIESMKQEEKEYREKVDSHFVQTAELFKNLTDQYRDVYKHMAEGADTLCSEEVKQLQADMSSSGLLIEAADISEEPEATEEAEEVAVQDASNDADAEPEEQQAAAEEVDVNIDDVLAEQHAAQTELENDRDPATCADEPLTDEDTPTVVMADDELPLAAEVEAPPEGAEVSRQVH